MKDQHAGPDTAGAELEAFLGRVRQALDLRDRTQADLARTLGVRPATVSDWFTGRTVPSGLMMLRLPKALSVDPAWLFTGAGSPSGSASDPSHRRDQDDALVDQLRGLLREFSDSSPD